VDKIIATLELFGAGCSSISKAESFVNLEQ